jgi:hypothetical protein
MGLSRREFDFDSKDLGRSARIAGREAEKKSSELISRGETHAKMFEKSSVSSSDERETNTPKLSSVRSYYEYDKYE